MIAPASEVESSRSDGFFGSLGDFDAEALGTIVNAIDQGLCIVEVKFDEGGAPFDYVFLKVNAAFETQTGIENAVGRSIRDIHPLHEEHWFRIYGDIARTGVSRRFVAEAAALGRWYDVYAFRLGEADRSEVAILFDDITERKLQEERYALLAREIDHRSRNMITLLSGLVQLTGGNDVEDYKSRLLDRLDSLHRSQEMLSRSGGGTVSYRELIERELSPYMPDGDRRVSYSGPAVALDRRDIQCLGMVLHELSTNAVKYGALSSPHGVISIVGRLEDGSLYTRWKEAGMSGIRAPAQRGVGTRVIESCVRNQMGGRITFGWQDDGLICEFVVPIEQGTPEA